MGREARRRRCNANFSVRRDSLACSMGKRVFGGFYTWEKVYGRVIGVTREQTLDARRNAAKCHASAFSSVPVRLF